MNLPQIIAPVEDKTHCNVKIMDDQILPTSVPQQLLKSWFLSIYVGMVWYLTSVLGTGLKLITVDRPFAERHYADLSTKPFFNGLVDYIISGPVVAMVWEGKGVVTTGRKIIGATNPAESAPGTIRGDYAIDIGRWVLAFLFMYHATSNPT